MAREPLERLLETVTDEELESLRDAILREEGKRRVQLDVTLTDPLPPLDHDPDADESTLMRWAKLLTWLAKEHDFPPAERKRGVSIKLLYTETCPAADKAAILLQQALVEAGLLIGRTPEWMDATTTETEQSQRDAVTIQMWDKPDFAAWD